MTPSQGSRVVCDVLVVGASLGGVAAALAAGRAGASVFLAAVDGWVGGQLTSQGVCTPDENAWVETSGATASYRALRAILRDHYRTRYRLSERGRAQAHLNVGGCWVSRLAVEPLVADSALKSLLAAHGGVTVGYGLTAVRAEVTDGQVTAVQFAGAGGGVQVAAAMVIDATELGDLLPLCGADHVVGAESRAETGEPDAPDQAHPDWLQPFTFPFALELRPRGENHTIAPPPDYAELRDLQRYHILDGAMRGMFGDLSWWSYRRIIEAANFADPAFPCDIAMVNTGSNDFRGSVIPTNSQVADQETLARARRASLGYVYWLQTECPREGEPGRSGYPEMRLRADLFATADGVAPMPYIRESRRIRALTTVTQQDVVTADSSGAPIQRGPRATPYPDACGIGHYYLDIHEGASAEPGRFMRTAPFQIPMGALIPRQPRNLLAGCKNLGVTHLANGAYRLHPIEWNVGEAAGALAAVCAARSVDPAAVHGAPAQRASVQRSLLRQGVALCWWTDLPAEHPAFEAAQWLTMQGCWPLGSELDFRPEAPLTPDEAAALAACLPPGVAAPRPGVKRSRAAADLLKATDERTPTA